MLQKLIGFAIALAPIIANAQVPASGSAPSFPNKPIRLIVPFPPGGAVDILGRAMAQKLTENLAQNVFVDNRVGGAGAVGSEAAAKSAPDGYTLLMGSTTTISINPSLFPKLPYEPSRDFVPVTLVAFVPHLLVVNAGIPAANLREFIAHAKARPGQLNYASAGNGTPHHIAAEMFKQMAGVDLVHIPYKGTGPAVPDLIAGQVSFMSVEILAAMPHVKAGKLRALGIATSSRNPSAPEIPTVSEAGLPGFEVTSWYGILAPAGTPKPITERLAAEMTKAIATPDLSERLSSLGATPVGNTPDEFGAHLRRESEKWAKAVKASGARVD
ncbi:MAG: Bug family tripartite tricarboxylate transporter substrate binding protein [Burkholderiales bacterium]